ncbi:MAG: DUF86 domain-containing protein [Snowella sp.]|nr:DUF86 domain-containing protein [Snowella sp.]
MPSPDDYLAHILLETSFLLRQLQGLEKSIFLDDELRQRAMIRSLEVIGEATKNLPDEFKRQHPQVPWRRMAGMRDRLIHGYFGIDYDIVWDVLVNQVPTLHVEIERLLPKLKD